MRYFFGFICVLALAVVPVGCGDDDEGCESSEDCDDGNQCTYNQCLDGRCLFSNKPDGTSCTRQCLIGSGECEDGECGRCPNELTCSSVHRDDAPGTWLLAVLGLLGIRLAARRKAKRVQAVDHEPRPTRRTTRLHVRRRCV
jgi:uncharacterized protein (TIGR03382 family)